MIIFYLSGSDPTNGITFVFDGDIHTVKLCFSAVVLNSRVAFSTEYSVSEIKKKSKKRSGQIASRHLLNGNFPLHLISGHVRWSRV